MGENSVYICPKCGSSRWKFTGQSSVSSMSLGGDTLACRDCSYVGAFLSVSKGNINRVKDGFRR